MTGMLKKYARKSEEKKDKVLPIRLTTSLYDEFQDYCNNLGLSMSEGAFLLIKQEIESSYKPTNYKEHTKDIPKNTKSDSKSYKEKNTNVVNDINNGERFTTKPYKVNEELPCPLCKEWYSSSNFSRHVKKNHDKTTKELFSENSEIIEGMVNQRKHS